MSRLHLIQCPLLIEPLAKASAASVALWQWSTKVEVGTRLPLLAARALTACHQALPRHRTTVCRAQEQIEPRVRGMKQIDGTWLEAVDVETNATFGRSCQHALEAQGLAAVG